jgi:hypothetical protein
MEPPDGRMVEHDEGGEGGFAARERREPRRIGPDDR